MSKSVGYISLQPSETNPIKILLSLGTGHIKTEMLKHPVNAGRPEDFLHFFRLAGNYVQLIEVLAHEVIIEISYK